MMLKLEMVRLLGGLQQEICQQLMGVCPSTCESVLWVAEGVVAAQLDIQVVETDSDIAMTAALPGVLPNSLTVDTTPETVLITGIRSQPLSGATDAQDVTLTYFQSLVPLPAAVEPSGAIALLDGNTLTLWLQKAWKPSRTCRVNILSNTASRQTEEMSDTTVETWANAESTVTVHTGSHVRFDDLVYG